jgi:1,5-anhydro-D-fructose reductase (1,5-anhydro-D-mannitol-forming)
VTDKRSKTYGVGILGTAHVHTGWYAREFRDSTWAEVKAVAEPDQECARAMLGDEAGHIKDFYTEPAEMLRRDDIEVVCIASQTSRHAEYAIAAAEARKHICMEKVIALTLDDADAIMRAAGKAGVKLICPPFVHDSKAEILKAKEIIDQGLIGVPTLAHFHTGHEGLIYSKWEAWFYDPAQSGGGALVDLGVHPIYEALFLFGEASEVSGMAATHYTERMLGDFPLSNIETDDNAVTTMRFKSGTLCVTDVSFTRMADRSNAAIYGTEGTIILGDRSAPLLYSDASGEWKTPDLPKVKPSVEVIVDLIENEEDTWRVNGKWSRDVLEVVLASYESSSTGRTVALPL